MSYVFVATGVRSAPGIFVVAVVIVKNAANVTLACIAGTFSKMCASDVHNAKLAVFASVTFAR
jgi:hypothetical protein